jgi:tetratricopeptide (TPR) repeat protein
MKRTILAGAMVLTAGFSSLLAQAPKGPTAKSDGEKKAINTMLQSANDPDAAIKAAEALLTDFADTEYKEIALSVEATSYQRKNDKVQAQVFGERVLEMNPHNFGMELLVGELIAQGTKEFDIDKDAKVAKATKLLNGAMDDIKASPKLNPQMSDADWTAAQQYEIAEAHNGLGTLDLALKKYDDGVKEFQMAWEGDPEQDAYGTRLASALLSAGKPAEAITVCDKLLAKPNLHPQIKQVVTSIKTAATAAKK